jgi:protocatechuate 4,5-dioxygenase alpha chain
LALRAVPRNRFSGQCAATFRGAMSTEGETVVSGPRDIHAYLAEFEDIPGTRVFTAKRARQGYHLNQFAMSLMKDENRERFRADESAYIDEWKLTPEQKDALLKRDYNRLLDLGGNVYFLAKVFSTDGQSFAQAVSTMTDMNFEDYTKMMVAGGRSPEGNRSIKEGR